MPGQLHQQLLADLLELKSRLHLRDFRLARLLFRHAQALACVGRGAFGLDQTGRDPPHRSRELS